MIQALLLSLLQLLSLIAFVRLFLPKKYVVLNPYAAGMDRHFSRLLETVQTALPLGVKPLCVLLILLAVALRATLLFRMGIPEFRIGLFFSAQFEPATFLGCFAFAALDFAVFWFIFQAAVLMLRLWHFWRPLPGFAGDLLELAAHPLSRLPLSIRLPVLICLAGVLVVLPLRLALSVAFEPDPVFMELVQKQLLPGRTPPQVPLSVTQIAVALFSFLPLVLSSVQSFLVLTLIFRIVSGFLKSKPIHFLTGELLTIFCGRLPRVGIGPFDLTPILAFFVFNVIVNLLAILCGVLLYVV